MLIETDSSDEMKIVKLTSDGIISLQEVVTEPQNQTWLTLAIGMRVDGHSYSYKYDLYFLL